MPQGYPGPGRERETTWNKLEGNATGAQRINNNVGRHNNYSPMLEVVMAMKANRKAVQPFRPIFLPQCKRMTELSGNSEIFFCTFSF